MTAAPFHARKLTHGSDDCAMWAIFYGSGLAPVEYWPNNKRGALARAAQMNAEAAAVRCICGDDHDCRATGCDLDCPACC